MEALAALQPGFLGIEAVRHESGERLTVSYWDSEDAIHSWQQHPEHKKAQATGIARWYNDYRIRIAKVERAYEKRSSNSESAS